MVYYYLSKKKTIILINYEKLHSHIEADQISFAKVSSLDLCVKNSRSYI